MTTTGGVRLVAHRQQEIHRLRVAALPEGVYRLHDGQIHFTGRYRVGSRFLAGDAAHRHPPVSALGLNTNFDDVHNPSWKLALVLQGKAPDTLLESYESERKPFGARLSEWALNGFRMRSLIDQASGLVPGQKEANWQAFERLYADTLGGAMARAILA